MFALPTRDGWVVTVRDSSMPKGKQAIESDLYTQHQSKAARHHKAMVAKHKSNPNVKIIFTKCIY